MSSEVGLLKRKKEARAVMQGIPNPQFVENQYKFVHPSLGIRMGKKKKSMEGDGINV